jgi:predicted CXXCH cytochrome family protein
MKPTQSMFFFAGALAFFVTLAALLFIPSQYVSAVEPASQNPNECLECHDLAYNLWEHSPHREANVSCTVCHKLADTSGEHPDTAKFTIESEDNTCLVCHTNVADQDIAGQMAISAHGEIGLDCVSCHEQHSQGVKLAEGSTTVCENCHKDEMETTLESTHFVAGLTCENCHMGRENNHTMTVSVASCEECHDNLHEAKLIRDAGLEIRVPVNLDAPIEPPTEPEEIIEETPEPIRGGVTLPNWVYVLGGFVFGGVIVWAVVGKEPGNPAPSD